MLCPTGRPPRYSRPANARKNCRRLATPKNPILIWSTTFPTAISPRKLGSDWTSFTNGQKAEGSHGPFHSLSPHCPRRAHRPRFDAGCPAPARRLAGARTRHAVGRRGVRGRRLLDEVGPGPGTRAQIGPDDTGYRGDVTGYSDGQSRSEHVRSND